MSTPAWRKGPIKTDKHGVSSPATSSCVGKSPLLILCSRASQVNPNLGNTGKNTLLSTAKHLSQASGVTPPERSPTSSRKRRTKKDRDHSALVSMPLRYRGSLGKKHFVPYPIRLRARRIFFCMTTNMTI